MSTLARMLHRTEQQMSGFRVVFDKRWDHQLALLALEHPSLEPYGGSLRTRFDRWARARVADRVSVHRLVLWYLWNPGAHKPPTYGQVLSCRPADALYGKLAHQLARKLRDGRHARRQCAPHGKDSLPCAT